MDNKKKLIMELPELDYALVYWEGNCTPWVAAWGYNKEQNCWGQGHYFVEKEDALRYLVSMYDKKGA